MIHFGVKKISNFGKELVACLILLVICGFASCDGIRIYLFQFSKNELQNDLCSIEIISQLEVKDGKLSFSVEKEITDPDEIDGIVSAFSTVKFHGFHPTPGMRISPSTTGIAFVYNNHKLIFSESMIYWTDLDDYKQGRITKQEHIIQVENDVRFSERDAQGEEGIDLIHSIVERYIDLTIESVESSE